MRVSGHSGTDGGRMRRSIRRRMPLTRIGGGLFRRAGRRTNLGLLIALTGAFVTGWLAFGVGTPSPAAIVSISHGAFGLALVVLIPWKNTVVRRAPRKAIASLAMLGLIVVCVLAGILAVLGGFRTYAGLTPMQIHVGAALIVVPLIVWHVVRHRHRQGLRRTDLSRRHLLRTAGLTAAAGAAYLVVETVGRLTGAPSAVRRETGSHRLDPQQIPVTIWLFDDVPLLDPSEHRVAVLGGDPLTRADLARHPSAADVRATLDCTNGWYTTATWRGVPLVDLLDPVQLAAARSIRVTSTTGYARTFPARDAARLWLATEFEGRDLTPGYGAPVRLVAPGRRGFWWVKWVASVELTDEPWWWQLPFPAQ